MLSDAYNHLSKEERAALIHEGSGSTTMSAFVEVIFDNHDRRLPTGGDEVAIRRTIGSKKDEYSLDKKSSTRSEIMNLLESAGFSRANPYYIVPQGRITALTNAKNTERLALLKEVAGTKVYEQRRSESERLMVENENKLLKINAALDDISTRLEDLEEEKEELGEFQVLDKRRRCLDYVLQDREMKAVEDALADIEEEEAQGAEEREQRVGAFNASDQAIEEAEAQLADCSRQKDHAELKRAHLSDDLGQLLRQKAGLEVELSEAEMQQTAAGGERESRDAALAKINAEIAEKRAFLESGTASLDQLKQQLDEAQKTLHAATQTRDGLLSRQGRGSQFKSKRERDSWLTKQVGDIRGALKRRQDNLRMARQDLVDAGQQIKAREDSIAKHRQTYGETEERLRELKAQVKQAHDARDAISDEKKNLWRQESYLLKDSDQCEQDVQRAEKAFSSTMDRNTSLGLASLTRVAEKLGVADRVYGPLCSLIDLDDKYKKAAEVTAGASLFHVVVSDDEVASKVIEQLIKEQSGRLTFMPLNKIRSEKRSYPDAQGVFPLVDKIACDDKFLPAVNQVFGKTIVCINLEVGAQQQRNHNLNAITLGGDRVDAKGVLTGGFHDPKRSRLDAARTLKLARDELEVFKAKNAEIKRATDALEERLNESVSQSQHVSLELQQVESVRQLASDGIRGDNAAVTTLRSVVAQKTELVESIGRELGDMESQVASYDTELQSDFSSDLTAEQQAELDRISGSIPGLRSSVAAIQTELNSLQMKRSLADNELQQNLYFSRDKLEMDTSSTSEELASTIASVSKKLVNIETELGSVRATLADAERASDKAIQQVSDVEARLVKLRDEQTAAMRLLSKFTKRAERVVARRAALEERREHVQVKIREIGILPDEAFAGNDGSDAELMNEFRTVTEQLKKYAHVNRKALEQYVAFTKDRDRLLERRENLESSAQSIQDLIETLNQQKDRAIKRTFQQVSKEFTEVFKQLVPAGAGTLIIERRSLEEVEQTPDSYIGVAINVSFNSTQNEQQRVEQLSGGQKSLCALALIFAIQRSDPAPFYLFDEIDANLDDQYRTAVAAVIAQIANAPTPTQFICTTFRNEMIHVADKFYGVLFNNKISTVKAITRDDALTFVDGQRAT